MSTLTATNRQTMVIAGILLGDAMLALHEWFLTHGFHASDLVWAAPAYALVILLPLSFNCLRGEFSVAQSLRGAFVIALAVALMAGWFGWSSVIEGAEWQSFGPETGDIFVFGLASAVVWFVALPFIQGALREGVLRFPYARLFEDAWRNILLLANCGLFTLLFWVLLALWAGLFTVLKIEFFKELFSSRFFAYFATAVVISFAVSLEEREASALRTLRCHLLTFQTRLLPLAALILILFLAVLPVAGLDPVWQTGHATPLMLSLQMAIIALTNAAWQDGTHPVPFSVPVQWLVRIALTLLPVLSILSIWSLSLRIGQYGWSVDRVWAALLVALLSLYSLGYAASAGRGWLALLGKVNTAMALLVIGTLLAVHTPLLSPARISASSQMSRLVSGATDVSKFDFAYLRFSLGRSGNEALRALSEISDHPKAETIRAKAKEAMARKKRFEPTVMRKLDTDEILTRLRAYPVSTTIPPSFADYLRDRQGLDHFLGVLNGRDAVPILSIDLGAGPEPELVLMAWPYPVFSRNGGSWRQVGKISFPGTQPQSNAIVHALDAADFAAAPPRWSELRVGDKTGYVQSDK